MRTKNMDIEDRLLICESPDLQKQEQIYKNVTTRISNE